MMPGRTVITFRAIFKKFNIGLSLVTQERPGGREEFFIQLTKNRLGLKLVKPPEYVSKALPYQSQRAFSRCYFP